MDPERSVVAMWMYLLSSRAVRSSGCRPSRALSAAASHRQWLPLTATEPQGPIAIRGGTLPRGRAWRSAADALASPFRACSRSPFRRRAQASCVCPRTPRSRRSRDCHRLLVAFGRRTRAWRSCAQPTRIFGPAACLRLSAVVRVTDTSAIASNTGLEAAALEFSPIPPLERLAL